MLLLYVCVCNTTVLLKLSHFTFIFLCSLLYYSFFLPCFLPPSPLSLSLSLSLSPPFPQVLMSELELQLQASLASTHNGSFLWQIPEIGRRRRDTIEERITSIYSPPFYTGRYGSMAMHMHVHVHISSLLVNSINKGPHYISVDPLDSYPGSPTGTCNN